MTQTVFTLLNWAFVDAGITTRKHSIATPNVMIFSKCFKIPSMVSLVRRNSFELGADSPNRNHQSATWASSSRCGWSSYAPGRNWIDLDFDNTLTYPTTTFACDQRRGVHLHLLRSPEEQTQTS